MIDRIHGTLVRTMYRILAPGHPRGRTDMHAVFETDRGDTLWIHTHGLEKLGFRELEFVGVPNALRGYAHGMLFDIMGYMKEVKPIEADEHFGGLLAHPEQRVVHYATTRGIDRPDEPEHDGFLRLVDRDRPADSGFPRRLFAAHIASLAERERSPEARERISRLALDAYKGSPEEWRAEGEVEVNPGNWLAWEVLGHALYDQRNGREGERCFQEVVERCPAAALRLSEIYREGIAAGALPPAEVDPRSRFWLSLEAGKLREAAESRRRISPEAGRRP
jgi:hypothetical protein